MEKEKFVKDFFVEGVKANLSKLFTISIQNFLSER